MRALCRDNEAQVTFPMEPFVRRLKPKSFYMSWLKGIREREEVLLVGCGMRKKSNPPTLKDLRKVE